jgi:SAM-dependent methyltransferase
VGFDVAAEAYGQFMGRFSEPLAVEFVALLHPQPGQRALDVGCGPGALTGPLVAVLGAGAVSAIDPSPSFLDAIRSRFPGVDVRSGLAESLPYADAVFDLTVAQLVVHFLADPGAALAEMARVTRPGGLVAVSVWDFGGGRDPLATFWRAVREEDQAAGEAQRFGSREGQLAELLGATGLHDVRAATVTARLTFEEFNDWWQPFTLGVGPAGDYVQSLRPDRRDRLRGRCEQLFGPPPFNVDATAWAALGRP